MSSAAKIESAARELLLVADAGHTRIKLAACRPGAGGELPAVVAAVAVLLGESLPWETVLDWFAGQIPVNLITGSNPPALSQLVEKWPAELGVPRPLADRSQLPITCAVDHPERVGIDRLLNAIAANRLRQPRQTAIIIDTGTAITVDAVASTGVFQGGAILPGVRMGAQALHRYTSTLPEIDAAEMFSCTPDPLGRNTQAAIESGLYWGHVGAVRELIFRQRDRLANFDKAKDAPSLLLFTGGAAPLLAPHFAHARFEPHLALQGLAVMCGQSRTSE